MSKPGAIQREDVDAVNLGNVIPFRPPRESATPLVEVGVAERPAPDHSATLAGSWLPALWFASLAAHVGIAAVLLLHRPNPVPSIGLDAIEVEVVAFGADKPAGIAPTPAEQESQPESPPALEEMAKQERAEVDAPVESEPPVPPTAETLISEKPKEPPKHEQAPSSPPVSSGVGRGQTHSDINYNGRVAAHLARYKRFPAAAQSQRKQGTAVISFTLDRRGGLVSAKLVKGSGVAALDQEVLAWVRRASPFPPPPSDATTEFTVPLSFQLR